MRKFHFIIFWGFGAIEESSNLSHPPVYADRVNPSRTKGFGTHTKHQGGRNGLPVSQERQMPQT